MMVSTCNRNCNESRSTVPKRPKRRREKWAWRGLDAELSGLAWPHPSPEELCDSPDRGFDGPAPWNAVGRRCGTLATWETSRNGNRGRKVVE